MSRLPMPRVVSSPDRMLGPAPTLKRKSSEDHDGGGPLKVSALSHPTQSGRPIRAPATNNVIPIPSSRVPLSNIPSNEPGLVGSKKMARSTSAPPKTVKPASTRNVTTRTKVTTATLKTGPAQRAPVEDDRIKRLQDQMTGIEQARMADTARMTADMDAERLKVSELQHNHQHLSVQLSQARSIEIETRRVAVNLNDELDKVKQKHQREVMELELDNSRQERELRNLKEEVRSNEDDLRRERATISSLKLTISQQETETVALKARVNAIQAVSGNIQDHLDASKAESQRLKSDLESQEDRIKQLEEQLYQAESLRRKLHNTIQELKGNIRVFCRVRPALSSELASSSNSATASIDYPDGREHREIHISSTSESATGQERKELWPFVFDRVFAPSSTQQDVFEEISQLAQSCTDGYNVCVFAYGQTGSGKSFTMEGGPTQETQGIIPRALAQVFTVANELKSKGWEYSMEGQFLEIYNESLNDLLGKGEFDKKKHEIKHEKGSTRVTDVVIVPLSSPGQVQQLLQQAQSRRSVAATLMNERSSRSHSVFTLRVSGVNSCTGESCQGSLNLVDLAGSERLNGSGVAGDKDRLRETQNINKSLSALADVIGALGEKSERGDKHIPYRNSKLTYLLQNSLSGNSKTLMVLNVSPLASHLGETLCSLRFATKVNNTTIGTARKQARVAAS